MMGSTKDHDDLRLPDSCSGKRSVRRPAGGGPVVPEHHEPLRRSGVGNSRLVHLRHHASLWLVPVGLFVAALFPWPYGYYNLLRLTVCGVSAWIAYEQWRQDDAVSGWVVAFGAAALLYNPVLPIHLTRGIWSVLNVVTAALFLGHLVWLNRIVSDESKRRRLTSMRSLRGVRHRPPELPRSSAGR